MNNIKKKFSLIFEFMLKISKTSSLRPCYQQGPNPFDKGNTGKYLTKSALTNPFIVYVLSFGTVLVVYQLGWSEIYPVLSLGLVSFFGLSFCASMLLMIISMPNVLEVRSYEPGRLPPFTVLLLIASFSMDLIYNGVPPLLSALQGLLYDRNMVPTLHVFNVAFGSAFATIRFTDYLYSKRCSYLAEAFIPIIFFLLLIYRGPIIMCLVSWGFVYFIKNGLNIKRGTILAAIALIVLYLFGSIGDIREKAETGSANIIEYIGKPTEAFKKTEIPRTYFWTYIYLTSPMANLQLITDTIKFNNRGLLEFFVSELTPDFISKRIFAMMGTQRIKTLEISKGLSVATMYGRPYTHAGYLGAFIMFAYLSIIILMYLHLIKRSSYGISGLALLNTLVVFCTFQNMIAHTPVILQLVCLLLCPVRKNKNNVILGG